MQEKSVNKIMDTAQETQLHQYSYQPKWDGFVNLYIFRYGPPWKGLFQNEEQYFYEEWYFIYFDKKGLAKKLKRNLVRPFSFNGSVEIDLESKSFIKN